MKSYQQFEDILPIIQKYKGIKYMIVHMKSQKGRTLNGKIGICTGYQYQNDTLRVFMKFDHDQVIYKIRLENLITLDLVQYANQKSQSECKPEQIKKCIRAAHQYMQQAESNISKDRTDIKHRFQLLQQHLKQYEKGNYEHYLKCGEYLPDQAIKNSLVHLLFNIKPGCLGDEKFRLREIFRQTDDIHQAGLRWAEYPISGFCVTCQKHYIQNNHTVLHTV